MRITRIYTKTGDGGMTSLVDGSKASKSDLRLHSYGTVDELNSHIAMLRDLISSFHSENNELEEMRTQIYRIQNELFDLGAELATPPNQIDTSSQLVISDSEIDQLEKEIDFHIKQLKPLKNFVIPGGNPANSQAHIARTVCRRAERIVVELKAHEPQTRDIPVIYLNRLSDWLFVIARKISDIMNTPEVLWDQSRNVRKAASEKNDS